MTGADNIGRNSKYSVWSDARNDCWCSVLNSADHDVRDEIWTSSFDGIWEITRDTIKGGVDAFGK